MTKRTLKSILCIMLTTVILLVYGGCSLNNETQYSNTTYTVASKDETVSSETTSSEAASSTVVSSESTSSKNTSSENTSSESTSSQVVKVTISSKSTSSENTSSESTSSQVVKVTISNKSTSSKSTSSENTSSGSTSSEAVKVIISNTGSKTYESSSSSTSGKTTENTSKLKYFKGETKSKETGTYVPLRTDKNSLFYEKDTSEDAKIWKFFEGSRATVGVGLDTLNSNSSKFYINSANTAYTEMYFGIKAEAKDKRHLTVKSYANIEGVELKDLKIVYEYEDVIPNYTLKDNIITADLYDNSFVNGLYVINAKFKYEEKYYTCNLYLYVNCLSDNEQDYEFMICRGKNNTTINEESPGERSENRSDVQSDYYKDWLNTNIAYPQEALYEKYYDTQFWIDKSSEIVKGYEDKSKEFKAVLLHDWMTENLVYDYYKVNVLKNPRYYNDYISGKYYVSKINVGVCRDFAYIYLIMCRAQKIPCALEQSETHAWNSVLLDFDWEEVDITADIQRGTHTEDMSDIPAPTEANTHSYYGFCNYNYNAGKLYPTGVNETLITY